jgi:hypothetical protein
MIVTRSEYGERGERPRRLNDRGLRCDTALQAVGGTFLKAARRRSSLANANDGGIPAALLSDMQGFILVFSGILLLGSTGAFFMYVSVLSIMAVVVILMALMLMFLLGVQITRQRIPVPVLPRGRTLRLVEALGLSDARSRPAATR